jgi:hypothetical protein
MIWLEHGQLGHLMRSTGVWTYAVVNLLHLFGIALLFGCILVLDLRLLGAWRSVPLVWLSRPTVTLAGFGFALAAITGVGLLATKATEYVGNPFLFIKFPAIALALLNVALVHRSAAWRAHYSRYLTREEHVRLGVHAAVSLTAWTTVVTAGRMIGYW